MRICNDVLGVACLTLELTSTAQPVSLLLLQCDIAVHKRTLCCDSELCDVFVLEILLTMTQYNEGGALLDCTGITGGYACFILAPIGQ